MSIYRIAIAITSLFLKLGKTQVIGKENIPKDRSLILIANHISFADPPALSYIYPHPITYIAKEEFAKNIFTRTLFSACGAVFLKTGESDLTAIRYAINQLKQERAVALFPEGKRNRDQVIGKFKGGASYIAYRTGATVLPISLINTGDFFRFWRRNIIIIIGKPIYFEQQEHVDKKELDKYNTIFEETIKKQFESSKELLTQKEQEC